MNSNKITILMPAYNTATYIGEAISSVLAQDFETFELLIIDDGSTDGTVNIVRGFGDKRIRIISQEHSGISAALNRGLQEANTNYIARFDADDICLPGRLRKQYDFLENNPGYVICGGEAEYISANGEYLFDFKCPGYSHEALTAAIIHTCPFIHSAVMYRKEAVLKAGGYPVHAHNFEDHILWIRLVSQGKFCNLQEQLIKVRFNPSSATIDEKWCSKEFNLLKRKILGQGYASAEDGERLKLLVQTQQTKDIKEGAYHALCGKKFLVNNHQPARARRQFSRAIKLHPAKWENYALYLLSFFPEPFIHWLYRKSKIQS
jgi:glycosyltransferase involved in cell wall biosynthesis